MAAMSLHLASVGSRFSANFIDGVVSLLVGVACFQAAKATGAPLALAVWGWFAYLLLCDALPGSRSVGKRLMGIAVVRVTTERPCSWWRAIVRRVPMYPLGILDIVFITGPARRRLGDYLAGTRVVNAAR